MIKEEYNPLIDSYVRVAQKDGVHSLELRPRQFKKFRQMTRSRNKGKIRDEFNALSKGGFLYLAKNNNKLVYDHVRLYEDFYKVVFIGAAGLAFFYGTGDGFVSHMLVMIMSGAIASIFLTPFIMFPLLIINGVYKMVTKTHLPGFSPNSIHDLQQFDVYNFENKTLSEELRKKQLTKEEVLALIKKISKDYHIPEPHVRFSKSFAIKGSVLQVTDENDKTFVELSDRSAHTVLHEMAHVIDIYMINDYYRTKPVAHGPYFVRRAIELYARYGGEDHDTLFAKAEKRGLLGPKVFADRLHPGVDSPSEQFTSRLFV